MGSPSEVTDVITNSLKNCKSSAIINANTNIGRGVYTFLNPIHVCILKFIKSLTTIQYIVIPPFMHYSNRHYDMSKKNFIVETIGNDNDFDEAICSCDIGTG